jgi:sigma-B regulation protein RsbU (phosphoserine phosphatase)
MTIKEGTAMLSLELVAGVSLLYIILLFLVGYYGRKRHAMGESIIANPTVYSLSITVYATSWTFYGSVGRAATSGLDFLLIYLGPSVIVFSWWYMLRKIVRISKENNITSIADFISSRYGKSQSLGVIITLIAILGIMPYIALQLKAISNTFSIITGFSGLHLPLRGDVPLGASHPGFLAAIFLTVFSIVFGARRLVSSERHEGLVAAIAVESVVKLTSFAAVGIFVTYYLFDGFGDIFLRMSANYPLLYDRLTTIGGAGETTYANWFSMFVLSMAAIMTLPRQFHILVIENSSEDHIREAMWRFPAYMFLINLFVVPIAFGGILLTGSSRGADYFVLTLPLTRGHHWLALLAFLGGFSAAAGMVMIESIAVSTMILNHLVMPIIVRVKPRAWFPRLLINLKRFGIFLVIFLGYLYFRVVGETFMLANMGLISFAAAAQFAPPLFGGLYWRKGNKAGAISGLILGFLVWIYTLLIPSFIKSGWWQSNLLNEGPFGIALLKPTELFGLTGFDIWSNSLFWSMFFNVGAYIACSLIIPQNDEEREQVRKFVDVFEPVKKDVQWETKRLSKPVTIMQFVNLMAKFIGEAEAHTAIAEYLGDREINENGGVSEFELPQLKRFTEKTLAASLGAAAAGAVVESFLTDQGSRLESVYDVFRVVRAELTESREALSVRLRASVIMNRTIDINIIMKELLDLLRKEFNFDLAVIRLKSDNGMLVTMNYSGAGIPAIINREVEPDIETYLGDAFLSGRPRFVNDTRHITKPGSRELMEKEKIVSFAHIPIAREGEQPIGIMSFFSRSIIGLFTHPFIDLLSSLAGQLAQAVQIDLEMKAKELEREQKEKALLENARVTRDLEIAKQIQLSLLPAAPPEFGRAKFAAKCESAAQVGGDYFDFFRRGEDTVDFVIADVSGHNVGSALIMVEARSFLRAKVHSTGSAGKMLATLNELLYEDLSKAELFISMFYVKYNVESQQLTYANAGHNHPFLYRPRDGHCRELDADGLILGVRRDVSFEEKTAQLQKGDILLLYTDGITEARNQAGDFFGAERLCAILGKTQNEPPEQIMEIILRKVRDFCGVQVIEDDISMIVMKVV